MILPFSNIVVGPYAGDSRIKDVEFVKSSPKAKDCPKDHRPEFAILGRSNVGKSSLINSLVRKKELALTSKKPGPSNFEIYYLVSDFDFVCNVICLSYLLQGRHSLLITSWLTKNGTLWICLVMGESLPIL